MKKNLFKILLLLLTLISLVSFSVYKKKSHNIVANNFPVSHLHGDFLINTDDPTEVVGAVDHVFVAKIESVVNTEYRDKVTLETENGSKEVYSPYTNYKISVIDNIKGKLKKNMIIDIVKEGGVSKEKNFVIVYENDILPEVGKYYILNAYTQEDGTLLISGPNSNILLNSQNKNDIVSSTEYKNYKKYYDNEKKITRDRFKSIYSE